MSRRLIVEADGGSRGNPGPAGYGALVRDAATGAVLAEAAEYIGVATNNVAEYRGLAAGLAAAARIDADAEVEARMDSKLVVEQMSGRWKVKHPDMRALADAAHRAAAGVGSVRYTWVPRADNADADRLANEAMDAKAQGRPVRLSVAEDGGATGGSGGVGEFRGVGGGPVAGEADTADGTGTADTVGPAASARRAAAASATAAPDPDPDPTPASATTAGAASPATEHGWTTASGTRTRLILLRHGETPLSVERRMAGAGDIELTGNGHDQAKAAARRLVGSGVDRVVSSPLRRCRDTAWHVAEALGLAVEIEDDLRETDFGGWEGLTLAEARERDPEAVQRWIADPEVAPPGGESFAEVSRRVAAARDSVIARAAGEKVVLVSHVTPIKVVLQQALLAPIGALYRMHLDTACLNEVDCYANGPMVVRSLNDTGHLA